MNSLEMLVTGYMEPFMKDFKDMKDKKKPEVFGNVRDIWTLSKNLVGLLKHQLYDWTLIDAQKIGELFSNSVISKLNVYVDYCANYDQSLAILMDHKMDDPKSPLCLLHGRRMDEIRSNSLRLPYHLPFLFQKSRKTIRGSCCFLWNLSFRPMGVDCSLPRVYNNPSVSTWDHYWEYCRFLLFFS